MFRSSHILFWILKAGLYVQLSRSTFAFNLKLKPSWNNNRACKQMSWRLDAIFEGWFQPSTRLKRNLSGAIFVEGWTQLLSTSTMAFKRCQTKIRNYNDEKVRVEPANFWKVEVNWTMNWKYLNGSLKLKVEGWKLKGEVEAESGTRKLNV